MQEIGEDDSVHFPICALGIHELTIPAIIKTIKIVLSFRIRFGK
jgi:hypothetical protein